VNFKHSFPHYCRVPNKATHGYDEGLIDSTDGDKVTVTILETKEVFPISDILHMLLHHTFQFRNSEKTLFSILGNYTKPDMCCLHKARNISF
jgi:hypothetical protein